MTIDTDEPTVAPTDPGGSRRSVQITLPSGRWIGRLAVLVLVAGLVAAVVITSLRLHHQRALTSARNSARLAATAYTEQFATYNYQDLAHDFSLTEAHSVSPFLDQYRKETAQIQPDLVKLKSSSTGKVLSAGVVSATTKNAVVDLFLNQTIANSASKQPRVDSQRVQMSMVRLHGRWLISKVTLP
jgi:Mce-associated membrane protein